MALFCPLWFCIHRNSAAPVMGSSDTWIDICLLWLPLPVMASLACYGLRDFELCSACYGQESIFCLGLSTFPLVFRYQSFGPCVDRVCPALVMPFPG